MGDGYADRSSTVERGASAEATAAALLVRAGYRLIDHDHAQPATGCLLALAHGLPR